MSVLRAIRHSRAFATSAGSVRDPATATIADGTGAKTFSSKVAETWARMSRTSKYLLGGYVAVGMTSIAVDTYYDGKAALVSHRDGSWRMANEWRAVIRGCNRRIDENIWDGIIWPMTLVMPSVVIVLNPPEAPKK